MLARDPEKAKKFGKKVEIVKGDLADPAALAAAFAGVEKLFVLVNGWDLQKALRLLRNGNAGWTSMNYGGPAGCPRAAFSPI